MSRILLLLALLLSSSAQAQLLNACGAPASTPNRPLPVPSCAPAPFGEGTLPTVRTNSAGVVAWWYCPQADGWHFVFRAATASVWTRDYIQALTSRLAAAEFAVSPTLELNNITASLATTPNTDPGLAAVWCPYWAEMVAGKPVISSPDGARYPPGPVIDSSGATWTISAGFAARNAVATNGHAVQILYRGQQVYVQSPTGLVWWRWAGANTWVKGTTAEP